MMGRLWDRADFDAFRPTFLESWPDGLAALAPPQTGLVLPPDDALALLRARPLWRSRLTAEEPAGLHRLARALELPIAASPGGAFLRLGSGSPKESPLFTELSGKVRDPVMAIKLLQTSRRVRGHIQSCLAYGCAATLFVRPWAAIRPDEEFRCFLRDRRPAGVSQGCRPGPASPVFPAEDRQRVQWRLEAFLSEVALACHLDSAVLDVWCPFDGHAFGKDAGRPFLLDINPWGPRSGAGLFDWRQPAQFNGRFLWAGG
jgi:hypothetical protein